MNCLAAVYTSNAPAYADNELRDGGYAGIAAGYDSYRVRQNVNLSTSNGLNRLQQTTPITPIGLVGGLFAGYGRYINNQGYLGAEIFLNGSRASATQSTTILNQPSSSPTQYSSTIYINHSYGFKIRPGVRLNPGSLFYLQIGYTRADIQTAESSPAFAVNTKNTRQTNGLAYGLGLEASVTQNVSVRAEYTHTKFNSFNQPSGSTFLPADNQFMLGLAFHFT
jgi:opacity protein-like surface antigen